MPGDFDTVDHEETLGVGKTILILVFVFACYAWASSQAYEDELALSQACSPAAGQVTLAKREDDGRVTCITMSNTGYGRAPRIVRAACRT